MEIMLLLLVHVLRDISSSCKSWILHVLRNISSSSWKSWWSLLVVAMMVLLSMNNFSGVRSLRTSLQGGLKEDFDDGYLGASGFLTEFSSRFKDEKFEQEMASKMRTAWKIFNLLRPNWRQIAENLGASVNDSSVMKLKEQYELQTMDLNRAVTQWREKMEDEGIFNAKDEAMDNEVLRKNPTLAAMLDTAKKMRQEHIRAENEIEKYIFGDNPGHLTMEEREIQQAERLKMKHMRKMQAKIKTRTVPYIDLEEQHELLDEYKGAVESLVTRLFNESKELRSIVLEIPGFMERMAALDNNIFHFRDLYERYPPFRRFVEIIHDPLRDVMWDRLRRVGRYDEVKAEMENLDTMQKAIMLQEGKGKGGGEGGRGGGTGVGEKCTEVDLPHENLDMRSLVLLLPKGREGGGGGGSTFVDFLHPSMETLDRMNRKFKKNQRLGIDQGVIPYLKERIIANISDDNLGDLLSSLSDVSDLSVDDDEEEEKAAAPVPLTGENHPFFDRKTLSIALQLKMDQFQHLDSKVINPFMSSMRHELLRRFGKEGKRFLFVNNKSKKMLTIRGARNNEKAVLWDYEAKDGVQQWIAIPALGDHQVLPGFGDSDDGHNEERGGDSSTHHKFAPKSQSKAGGKEWYYLFNPYTGLSLEAMPSSSREKYGYHTDNVGTATTPPPPLLLPPTLTSSKLYSDVAPQAPDLHKHAQMWRLVRSEQRVEEEDMQCCHRILGSSSGVDNDDDEEEEDDDDDDVQRMGRRKKHQVTHRHHHHHHHHHQVPGSYFYIVNRENNRFLATKIGDFSKNGSELKIRPFHPVEDGDDKEEIPHIEKLKFLWAIIPLNAKFQTPRERYTEKTERILKHLFTKRRQSKKQNDPDDDYDDDDDDDEERKKINVLAREPSDQNLVSSMLAKLEGRSNFLWGFINGTKVYLPKCVWAKLTNYEVKIEEQEAGGSTATYDAMEQGGGGEGRRTLSNYSRKILHKLRSRQLYYQQQRKITNKTTEILPSSSSSKKRTHHNTRKRKSLNGRIKKKKKSFNKEAILSSSSSSSSSSSIFSSSLSPASSFIDYPSSSKRQYSSPPPPPPDQMPPPSNSSSSSSSFTTTAFTEKLPRRPHAFEPIEDIPPRIPLPISHFSRYRRSDGKVQRFYNTDKNGVLEWGRNGARIFPEMSGEKSRSYWTSVAEQYWGIRKLEMEKEDEERVLVLPNVNQYYRLKQQLREGGGSVLLEQLFGPKSVAMKGFRIEHQMDREVICQAIQRIIERMERVDNHNLLQNGGSCTSDVPSYVPENVMPLLEHPPPPLDGYPYLEKRMVDRHHRQQQGTSTSTSTSTSESFSVEVTTLAGFLPSNGNSDKGAGYRDGRAEMARFRHPMGVSINHKNGDVYVADSGNNRIRKITPNGEVSTVIGSGKLGWKDGSPLKARMRWPSGVFVEADKENDTVSIWVADTGNNCIRLLKSNGELERNMEESDNLNNYKAKLVTISPRLKKYSVLHPTSIVAQGGTAVIGSPQLHYLYMIRRKAQNNDKHNEPPQRFSDYRQNSNCHSHTQIKRASESSSSSFGMDQKNYEAGAVGDFMWKRRQGFADGGISHAQFERISAVAIGPKRELYFASPRRFSNLDFRVRVLSNSGEVRTVFGGCAKPPIQTKGQIQNEGIAATTLNSAQQKFEDIGGDFKSSLVENYKDNRRELSPAAVASLYGIDSKVMQSECIRKPTGFTVSPSTGYMYFSDPIRNVIVRIPPTGKPVRTVCGSTSTRKQNDCSSSWKSNNDNRDQFINHLEEEEINHNNTNKNYEERSRKVVPTLREPLSSSWHSCRDGSGRNAAFWEPRGLAIRALPNSTEELYVADSRNNVIRKVVIRYANRKT